MSANLDLRAPDLSFGNGTTLSKVSNRITVPVTQHNLLM
jgi:hypothetical protein